MDRVTDGRTDGHSGRECKLEITSSAVKAHSGVASLCSRNLGTFKRAIHHKKEELIITFCVLSPLHSSLGLVSTKSARAVFFFSYIIVVVVVVAQFSALVNQSGVALTDCTNC